MLCRAAIVFYPDQSEGRAVKIWFHKLRNYFRIRSIISPEINEERTMNYVVLKYTDVPLVHLSFLCRHSVPIGAPVTCPASPSAHSRHRRVIPFPRPSHAGPAPARRLPCQFRYSKIISSISAVFSNLAPIFTTSSMTSLRSVKSFGSGAFASPRRSASQLR